MRVSLYQLDVFADQLFAGNPAAVCPLQAWLPDALMQQIAAENNLSETAFFVADDSGEADFLLRWFTPTQEIELCGHATLACCSAVNAWLVGVSSASQSCSSAGGNLATLLTIAAVWLALG